MILMKCIAAGIAWAICACILIKFIGIGGDKE